MKRLALIALAGLALPAQAQSLVPGPNQPGRYEMQAVPGGVARLDTVTGDVSLCRVEDETLRCRPSEDEDDAPRADRRAAIPDDDAEADADRSDRRPEARTDSDADIDKAIRRMKKLFHAFGDIARDFEGGAKHDNGDSDPDRT